MERKQHMFTHTLDIAGWWQIGRIFVYVFCLWIWFQHLPQLLD
jgi:hypothetical protein